MSKPALLIVQPHLGFLVPVLEPHFTVWKLSEGPPVEAVNVIEALVVAGEFPIDTTLAEAMPKLGLIACFTVGYDGVDLEWAAKRGLKVTHSPGANADDVADHALGLVLASWRKIVEGDRRIHGGEWRATEKTPTPSLTGKRVGIVGLGAIGAAIATRCEAFRLDVGWWGPREKPDAPWPRAESLEALARASDILIVSARASEENRASISKTILDALGPNGLLVNVSRGQVVDEDALIEALRERRLGMAALDVFVSEPTPAERWSGVPNVVLTPHTAGATLVAGPRMAAMTLENLRCYFAGKPLPNALDLP